jgi:DNA-binding transcriptional regulator YiaG
LSLELTYLRKVRGGVRDVGTCEVCESPLRERKATTRAPYRYDLSGLKDVFLSNILVRRCVNRSCKAESPVIPKIASLHRRLTEILIDKQSLLSGDEIRFLRKNAEFPAKHFAELIGETPEHLSRVECGKTHHLGKQADKLARAVSIACAQGGEASKALLLRQAESRVRAKQIKLFLTLKDDHWESETIAVGH